MKHSIARSTHHAEKADKAMTAALEAIEARDYMEAKVQGFHVLTHSESIEQRIAALYVMHLAVTADEYPEGADRLIEETLRIAYRTAD